jgi:hypothetical protein
MDTEPSFGFEHLVSFAVTEMATAVSVRYGESPAQQFARCQAAVHMVMGFQPRDATEVMLAGHCVMLHEVMTADIRDGLRGEAATNRRTLIALNKAFNDDLDRLERYRQRPAEGKRDAPEVPPITASAAVPAAKPEVPSVKDFQANAVESADSPVPAKLNRAARRQAARAESRAVATASRAASRQTVTNCRANPDAMAALAAGDPDCFARVLGIATPSAAFLAAAKTPGSPFDPQAMGPWPIDELAGTREG